MMPISANVNSSAKGTSNSGFDNSGFSVNFGSGSAGGGVSNQTLLIGLAVAAVVFMLVRKGKK